MAIGIYKIINKINNKVYIGQSRRTPSRWYQHKAAVEKPPKGNDTHLVSSMRRYGVENFTFEVIEECSVEELNDREIYWIEYYNSTDEQFGYNVQSGGKSSYNKNTNTLTRLTLKEVEEITEHLLDTKLNQSQIASMYGMEENTITNINMGNTWVRDGIDYPIRKNRVRIPRPSREELIQSLANERFPNTYRKYNTTLSVMKGWCRVYGIPDNYQEFVLWCKENNIKTR